MKAKALAFMMLISFALLSSAQEITFPEVQGYKKITKYPVYVPSNLWDFINGAADNYLALGFVDLHVAEYKKGKETIKLEIYKHSNPTMAFGIYASERSSSFRFLNLGSQGYAIDGSINFFKGNYYVKVRTYSDKPKTIQTVESLATRVADMLEGESRMPVILSRFPAEGKKQNEETYINESVLGHQFLSNAFKAIYEAGSDNFSIFLIQSDSASEALSTVNSYLKSAGMEVTTEPTGKLVINDAYNGTVFLSWKDDIIVLISNLAKDQADVADRYTTEILN